jgi:hypothetical protein
MMNTHTDRFLLPPRGGRGRRLLTFGLIAMLSGSPLFAEMRTWRTKDGRRVEAEYVREFVGTVFFKDADRKQISIELDDLSEKDLNYLRTTVPPELDLKFSKRTSNKERSVYNWYHDDVIEIVTGIVQVEKKSKAAFDGQLRAEIYFVADEVSTSEHSLVAKHMFLVEFSKESRGRFVHESSVEVRRYRDYPHLMRGANYAGHLVVVFGPLGNRIATMTDLPWLDDDEVELLRSLPEKTFFNDSCRKVSVPRPKYYTDRYLFR